MGSFARPTNPLPGKQGAEDALSICYIRPRNASRSFDAPHRSAQRLNINPHIADKNPNNGAQKHVQSVNFLPQASFPLDDSSVSS